jgi:hypothetical protein
MSDLVHLKPVAEWDDKDVARAPYDMKHLAGPQVTGTALTVFRMMCETSLMHKVLYTVYMAKNALPQASSGGGWGGGGAQSARAAGAAAHAAAGVACAAPCTQ